MKLEKNWFYSFCVALSVIGMGYILICGVSRIGGNQEYPYAMKGMLLSVFFLVWVGVHFLALLSARLGIAGKLSERKKISAGLEVCYVILVLAAAFILRYAVILNLPMEPASDYKTYYEIAEMLKNGTLQDKGEGYCDYIAMFPHIIGYCYILKQVFVLFGTSVFHGQFANILFSVGTVFLIYRIGRRLGGRLAGLIALTAAAFWPSQIIYINMLAAEYAFSFFLYLSVLLFLHLVMDYDGTTKHAVMGILLHILLGCLIAVAAAIRPMALILLIAIILCMLPQKMKLPGIPRNSISIWVRFLGKGWLRGALILVSYMILSGILTTDIELVINRTVPSTGESLGYNLLVGLNTEANGGWNEEDSKFLYENLNRTGFPIQAQIACRNQAFVRLTSDPEAIFNLFINKYELLWGNDDYGATWNLAFLKEQNTLTPERADILYRAQNANHIVYMVFILFTLMTLIYLLQRKASYVYVLILIYLGTAAMHIFVESQNRYHFHVLPVIMIAAAVGIGYIFENAIVYVKSSDLQKQEKERMLSKEKDVLKQFEEEEHKAIETRYKSMTNAFDMQSAIHNGNVIVTVSEKYRNPSSVETVLEEKEAEVENRGNELGEPVEESLEEIILALEQFEEPEEESHSQPEEDTQQILDMNDTSVKESLPQGQDRVELNNLLDKIEQLERNQKDLLDSYMVLQKEMEQVKAGPLKANRAIPSLFGQRSHTGKKSPHEKKSNKSNHMGEGK